VDHKHLAIRDVPLVVLLQILVFLPGCMMVRAGTLQAPAQWPPNGVAQATKKSVHLAVTARHAPGGAPRAMNTAQQDLFQGEAQKAYMESGLFSGIAASAETADLRAEIEVIEEGNEALASVSGFVSGFTMGVIPGYASERVILVTTMKDKNDKELVRIQKSESISFWIQILLVGVMPFREGPAELFKGVLYDLNRTTLVDAQTNGVL
jgi:hypothetical protein